METKEKCRWLFEQILEAKQPENNSYTSTCLPFHKPSKKDEQNILGTARKARTNA